MPIKRPQWAGARHALVRYWRRCEEFFAALTLLLASRPGHPTSTRNPATVTPPTTDAATATGSHCLTLTASTQGCSILRTFPPTTTSTPPINIPVNEVNLRPEGIWFLSRTCSPSRPNLLRLSQPTFSFLEGIQTWQNPLIPCPQHPACLHPPRPPHDFEELATATHFTMAEQQTPTFKLVLVGDGGTGKVRYNVACGPSGLIRTTQTPPREATSSRSTSRTLDHKLT